MCPWKCPFKKHHQHPPPLFLISISVHQTSIPSVRWCFVVNINILYASASVVGLFLCKGAIRKVHRWIFSKNRLLHTKKGCLGRGASKIQVIVWPLSWPLVILGSPVWRMYLSLEVKSSEWSHQGFLYAWSRCGHHLGAIVRLYLSGRVTPTWLYRIRSR